ncbi:DUF134 domain-containing protein, partial [Oceanispirochaeta sp.]|uniref:DUF134 domain-containing protein n=1 Tax=Oceanispirochaeta sp. TaxID=2035350 RepID=UPI002623764B
HLYCIIGVDMPRRCKQRNCRRLDGNRNFKPSGIPARNLEKIELKLDEFEALRLCDYDGLNQIEAGEAMGISRGTVQRLLLSGRKKIVDVLLHTKELIVKNEEEEIL